MEPTQQDSTQNSIPQPGSIVVPQATEVPSPAAIPVAEEAIPVESQVPVEADSAEIDLTQNESELSNDSVEEDELAVSDEPAFQWQASEYVQHHKGAGWYMGLAGVFLILLGVAIFTQQWLSIAVFVVMAVAVVVYAHKPPRILTYMLDFKGITIEDKFYGYDQFRSFAVLQNSEWHAIDLEPTQRFMPRLTVIFVSEDLDGIVEHLSLHLPRSDRQPDLIERLTRYVRF